MTRRKILIVKDGTSVVGDLDQRVGRLGYEVVATASTRDEAKVIAAESPDLAFVELPSGGEAFRKIRDDENYWHTAEGYISEHTTTLFSHSICPSCMASEVEPHFSG